MSNPKLTKANLFSFFGFVLVLAFSFANFAYANEIIDCHKDNCSDLAEEYFEQGDIPKATQLYSKGCQLNDRTACYRAATIYAQGDLGEQDFSKAKPFYKKACEMKEADSCSDLGDEYDSLKEMENARIYFAAACNLDHAYGCQQLAWKLNHDITPRDLKQAAAMNQKACDMGNGWACNNLGYDYMGYDDEVNPYVQKDYDKGIKLMTLACDSHGKGSACTSLSYAHEKGHGVKINESESLRYAIKACEGVDEPDAGGCSRAGYDFSEGIGVEKDLDKSIYYYELACSDNHSGGCYGAGYHYSYEVKKTTKATKQKAKYFFDLACELGDEDAC